MATLRTPGGQGNGGRKPGKGGGRPTLRGEVMQPRSVKLPPTVWEALKSGSGSVNGQVLQAVEAYLSEKSQEANRIRLPLLGKAPMGALREALNEARKVDIGEVGERLRIGPDDFLMEGDGVSMVSADVRRHIPDGAWILFRPYMDATNEVALCRVELEDESFVWTIKKYTRGDKNDVKLLDGANQVVQLPERIRSIVPVAVKRGIITDHLDIEDADLKKEIEGLENEVADLENAAAMRDGDYPGEFFEIARRSGYNAPSEFAAALVNVVTERGYEATYEWLYGAKHPDQQNLSPKPHSVAEQSERNSVK